MVLFTWQNLISLHLEITSKCHRRADIFSNENSSLTDVALPEQLDTDKFVGQLEHEYEYLTPLLPKLNKRRALFTFMEKIATFRKN